MKFLQFTDFCVLYISKTVQVRNSKQTTKFRIFLMFIQYNFQPNYLSVTRVSFVKVEVKLDQVFVNLTVRITCCMGWKIENKLNFICLIFNERKYKACMNLMMQMLFEGNLVNQSKNMHFFHISRHKSIPAKSHPIQFAYVLIDDIQEALYIDDDIHVIINSFL